MCVLCVSEGRSECLCSACVQISLLFVFVVVVCVFGHVA